MIRTNWITFTALLVVAALVIIGCAPQAPATTPTTTTPSKPAERQVIKVSAGHPLSGAYATTSTPIFNGWLDYFKYLEDVEGGLTFQGTKYKVETMWTDTKLDIPTAISIYKRYADEGAVCYGISSSPESTALNPVSRQVGLSFLGAGGTDDQFKNGDLDYNFTFDPHYAVVNAVGIKWYKDNVWKGTGKMKVGRLYVDTAMGKNADTEWAVATMSEDLGVELLPAEWFPNNVSDFTPFLVRLRDQNPDIIFFQGIAEPYALCLKDAARLGMKADKPQFMSTFWGGTTLNFIKSAGAAGENSMSTFFYKTFWDQLDNPSNPLIKALCDRAEKYQGTRRPPDNYAKGFGQGLVMRTAIERALAKSGYPVKKEHVYDALKTFSNFDFGVGAPITWTNGRRLGTDSVGIIQVQNGQFKILADYQPGIPGIKTRAPYVFEGGKP